MSTGYLPTWHPHDPYRQVREALVGDEIELYQESAVFKAWVDAMTATLEMQRQAMVMTCQENEHLRNVALNCLKTHSTTSIADLDQ